MKNCGYDLLVQIDERLLNKALAGLFYTGALKKSGKYAFVEGVPDELRGFVQAEYQIRLRNEPYIDFLKAGTVGIRGSVEVVLKVLGGVRVELDADFGASAEIRVDMQQGKLILDMVQSTIYDMLINDRFAFHKNTLANLNQIVKILLGHYVTEDIKEITLPVSVLNMPLPETPEGPDNLLPVRLFEVTILDGRYIFAGINVFDAVSGNPTEITDMADGADFAAAMKVNTLKKIAAFWWERTSREKGTDVDGSFPVNGQRYLAKLKDIILRAVTLGILQTESDVANAALHYSGHIKLVELPEINFADTNEVVLTQVKIKLKIQAALKAAVRTKTLLDTSGLIPDKVTPWQDDKQLGDKIQDKTLIALEDEISVLLRKAICRIHTDEKNRLVVKVDEADVHLDFGDRWVENFSEGIMNKLLDVLEKTIIAKLPPIVISPSLLLVDKKIMGYTLETGIVSVVLHPEELIAAVNVSIKELSEKEIVMPLYIANRRSMKLHRFDCHVVEEIDFAHRAGYHGVYEAVLDGYKPCGECLKGYPVKQD
ncbi:hypothetical protein LPY66_13185 [Dehalobacter sp. DCM]|uniref:hypothetical protein n=1 Tax=Dehalobacter sp. DCM TaxID=2907827 RepID=UPI003081F386|nr:hypothetical protein LPY66_13185 [Dehalobacter sp. DCM]